MDIIEFVSVVVKEIVDLPDEVNIESQRGEKTISILIKVAKDDIGKMIGKRGQMIMSIRTICKNLAVKQNKRVVINIIE